MSFLLISFYLIGMKSPSSVRNPVCDFVCQSQTVEYLNFFIILKFYSNRVSVMGVNLCLLRQSFHRWTYATFLRCRENLRYFKFHVYNCLFAPSWPSTYCKSFCLNLHRSSALSVILHISLQWWLLVAVFLLFHFVIDFQGLSQFLPWYTR